MNRHAMASHVFLLLNLAPFLAWGGASEGISAVLGLEKTRFAVGEPVVLRIVVHNESESAFRFPGPYGVDLAGWYMVQSKPADRSGPWRPFLGGVPLSLGLWRDRYYLQPSLPPGGRAAAVHLLLGLEEKGNWSLRAVFGRAPIASASDPAPEAVLLESREAQVSVEPLPKGDSARALAESGKLHDLSKWVARVYYSRGQAGLPPEGPVRDLAERLRSSPHESVFGEYVLYAYAMLRDAPRAAGKLTIRAEARGAREAQAARAAQEAAERFLAEYPESFLRAEVYQRLFETHYVLKEYAEAVQAAEAGNKLEESDPLYRNTPWFMTEVAQAYDALGRKDGVRRWAERVMAEYPDPEWAVHDKAQELMDKIEGRPHPKPKAPPTPPPGHGGPGIIR